MNKHVLTHQYKLDIATNFDSILIKKKPEDIQNIVVISENDSIILYSDFAFRITSNPEENTTIIHSSKPLYINKTNEFIQLEFE